MISSLYFKIGFAVSLLFKVTAGQSQDHNTENLNDILKCRSNWIFSPLTDTLTGTVVADLTSRGCGILITASLSYIKISESDTVRVIRYCDESPFAPGQKVKITSDNELLRLHGSKLDPGIYMGIYFFEADQCTVFFPDCRSYKTFYGSLEPIKAVNTLYNVQYEQTSKH